MMTRTRMLIVAAVSTVCVVASTPAHAQRVPARSGAPLSERLDASTRLTIARLADSLDLEELPGYALRDKAAEGVLKGATDVRVIAAVVSLAERLRESRALLGREALDDEYIAAASALYTGVSRSGIARLVAWKRSQRSSERTLSLAMPLAVLADLTAQRVPGDLALGSLESLLVRGARDRELAALREAVGRDIRRGERPVDAFTAGVRSTSASLKPPHEF